MIFFNIIGILLEVTISWIVSGVQLLRNLRVACTASDLYKKGESMEKPVIKGITIGNIVMVLLAVSIFIGCEALNKPKFAEVVEVKEIVETTETPREVCEDMQVRQQAPVKDPHRITGTVIGGVAGGVLGSQVGKGTGKTLATVGGAAGGAYVGNKVQESMQKSDVVTTTKRKCKTVYDRTQKVVGYDVTYRLSGKEGVVRTTFKPGPTLPVKDGQVVLTPPVSTP